MGEFLWEGKELKPDLCAQRKNYIKCKVAVLGKIEKQYLVKKKKLDYLFF